jgi:hydroxyacylglutathione hydrolase
MLGLALVHTLVLASIFALSIIIIIIMPIVPPITIEPLAAFSDNYIWWLSNGRNAAVVDPGDAAPVVAKLAATGQRLSAILATHHHADHIGAIPQLAGATRTLNVYGPANEAIEGVTQPLQDGARIDVLGVAFEVLAVPGHTRGHLAYYAPALEALFCGDTLFACGCGRVFEGTAAQMAHSLARLAALPASTRVYCAHEYTLANIRFALAVEPDNTALQQRAARCSTLRADNVPTLPSTIGEELATNPFLRTGVAAVRACAAAQDAAANSPETAFAVLRAWKDRFR